MSLDALAKASPSGAKPDPHIQQDHLATVRGTSIDHCTPCALCMLARFAPLVTDKPAHLSKPGAPTEMMKALSWPRDDSTRRTENVGPTNLVPMWVCVKIGEATLSLSLSLSAPAANRLKQSARLHQRSGLPQLCMQHASEHSLMPWLLSGEDITPVHFHLG